MLRHGVAHRATRLPLSPHCNPPSAEAGEQPAATYLSSLRAGEDGALWVVEYVTGPEVIDTYVLRRLDGEGAELFRFSAPGLARKLEASSVYDMLQDDDGDICAV